MTKRSDPGWTPPRERYDGPLRRTLRAAGPDGRRAKVAFLSARYGFRTADTPIEDDHTRLILELAARMIAGRMTTRRSRSPSPDKPDFNGSYPGPETASLRAYRREPFRTVALVGGGFYLGVMRAILDGFVQVRLHAPRA